MKTLLTDGTLTNLKLMSSKSYNNEKNVDANAHVTCVELLVNEIFIISPRRKDNVSSLWWWI